MLLGLGVESLIRARNRIYFLATLLIGLGLHNHKLIFDCLLLKCLLLRTPKPRTLWRFLHILIGLPQRRNQIAFAIFLVVGNDLRIN